jgi:hypothetical protein
MGGNDAACEGHIELLQWAVEHGCPWKADKISGIAAVHGHVEIEDWVTEHVNKVRSRWFITSAMSSALWAR